MEASSQYCMSLYCRSRRLNTDGSSGLYVPFKIPLKPLRGDVSASFHLLPTLSEGQALREKFREFSSSFSQYTVDPFRSPFNKTFQVYLIWAIDSFDAALAVQICYHYLVSNYANPSAILFAVWSLKLHVLITVSSIMICNSEALKVIV